MRIAPLLRGCTFNKVRYSSRFTVTWVLSTVENGIQKLVIMSITWKGKPREMVRLPEHRGDTIRHLC
nr:MAG TPA: hypothetical protein [Bacteriophage sp.]